MSAQPSDMQREQVTLFVSTIHRFLNVYRYLRKYGREIQSQGLSGREVSLVRYLLDAAPASVGQCRDYLYINDSSTSELIARLEGAGFVSRARSLHDSRSVLVTLTTAGREAATTLPLNGIPLLREKLKTLSPDEMTRIHDAMGDIQRLLGIDDGN